MSEAYAQVERMHGEQTGTGLPTLGPRIPGNRWERLVVNAAASELHVLSVNVASRFVTTYSRLPGCFPRTCQVAATTSGT